MEIKTALPFITAPTRMNYLGIKLTNDRKRLAYQNNKTWIRDILKIQIKRKTFVSVNWKSYSCYVHST